MVEADILIDSTSGVQFGRRACRAASVAGLWPMLTGAPTDRTKSAAASSAMPPPSLSSSSIAGDPAAAHCSRIASLASTIAVVDGKWALDNRYAEVMTIDVLRKPGYQIAEIRPPDPLSH